MKYKKQDVLDKSLEYFKGDTAATDVFINKYALRDKENNYYELTPDDMHHRLAREFCRIELTYTGWKDAWNVVDEVGLEEAIYQSFKGFEKIIPQGSPMFGIGNDFQLSSIANCFVIPGPYDSYAGILHTDQEAISIFKRRGGVGFDIGNLRPKDMPVQNAALSTSGIEGFMERYSNSVNEVCQNGRRGALMMTIPVEHMEIETFINIKNDPKKVTGANISIKLTDEFMKAVEQDGFYTQKYPIENPTITKQVKARYIWNQIINSAHGRGEPGLLNWSTILRDTPSEIYKEEGFGTVSTNPCLTGDTRVATQFGLVRIDELAKSELLLQVSVDNRLDNNGFGITVKSATQAVQTSSNEEVFLVETDNGYSFKATAYHKVPTSNGIVELKDLKIGNELLIQSGEGQFGTEGNEKIGTVIGWIEGDGCFCYSVDDVYLDFWGNQKYLADIMLPWCLEIAKDEVSGNGHDTNFGIKYENKNDKCRINSTLLGRAIKKLGYTAKTHVPEIVWKGTKDCVRGYIRGLFAADGHIEYAPLPKQSFCIRLSQTQKSLLEDVQILLSNFGITSKIYDRKEEGYKLMPDGNGGLKEYFCQKQYCLDISSKSAVIFEKEIGFILETNQKMFNDWKSSWTRGPYKELFTSKVINIKPIGFEPVYCLTQPNNNTFIANGLITGNCGEILINNYGSCRLTALNLVGFIKNAFEKNAYFDYTDFSIFAQRAQRLMDNIVDLEIEKVEKIIKKIESDPEPLNIKRIELDLWNNIKKDAIVGRRTGLGITGLGDCLAALSVKYGSDESLAIVEKIFKTLAINAYKSSCIMAGERGTFPIYNYGKEVGHPFLEKLFAEDKELYDLYRRNGKRNIAILTCAPNGSTSQLCGTTSGIEPVFAVEYQRSRKLNSEELKSTIPDFTDQNGVAWKNYIVYHPMYKKWMDVTGNKNYNESPYYKAAANDIDWKSHVDVQAKAQMYIDHSISKTINLPENTPKQLVSDIYMYAYKNSLKGITVYRDKCRTGVLNNIESDKKTEELFAINNATKRPKELPCEIHFVQYKGNKYVVLIGLLKGKCYEVFFGSLDKIKISPKDICGKIQKKTKGKYNLILEDGSIIEDIVQELDNTEMATISRLTSMSLRHNVAIEFVVEQLNKDGFVNDFNKVLARVLKKYIKDQKVIGDKCHVCNSENIVYEQGCKRCVNCGESKCG